MFVVNADQKDITEALQQNIGKVLVLPEGLDWTSRPFEYPAGTHSEIIGGGEHHTKLRMQDGGFHVKGVLKIHNMSIWRSDAWVGARADNNWGEPTFGIFAEGRVTLSEMTIEGFTIGLRVWADHTNRGTNANACRVQNVTIKGCGLQGWHFRGRDSNAFSVISLAVYSAGEHGKYFVERDKRLRAEAAARGEVYTDDLGLPCGGWDKAFLGGSYFARLVSSSHETLPSIDEHGNATIDAYGRPILDDKDLPFADKDGKPIQVRIGYAPIIWNGDSNHGADWGPYHESDQDAAQYDRAVTSIGGCATLWDSSNKEHAQHGMRLDGSTCTALEVINDLDPKNRVITKFGRNAGSGSFFALHADTVDGSRPLRGKAIPKTIKPISPGGYMFDIANGTTKCFLIYQNGTYQLWVGNKAVPFPPAQAAVKATARKATKRKASKRKR